MKVYLKSNSTFSPFRYLFFLDVSKLKQSLKICVKKCPDRSISKIDEVCEFYKDTGSQLCLNRPGIDFGTYCNSNKTGNEISCPVYPVHNSIHILNRCIPKAVSEITKSIASNLYGLINSWDVIEQILGDLYKTWREILALSFLSFGM